MRCVILDDYQDVAHLYADWESLEGVEVTTVAYHTEGDDLLKLLDSVEIVVAMRERTSFRADLLDRLPSLRLLVTTGMRNASIDMVAAAERGITVCGTQSSPTPPVELTWALKPRTRPGHGGRSGRGHGRHRSRDRSPARVPVEWLCFDAARKSFAALTSGKADIGFLAVEPARAEEVFFTAPYVLIEGVYAVRVDSPITTADTVDRPGVRVGVKHGSAYDLYLTRTLQHAELVRGAEGVDIFRDKGLEVAAGIRQPLSRHVVADPELRLVEPRFMEIRQAVATTKDRSAATVQWLRTLVEEFKSSGFVARALARSGQDASVAPPG